MTRVPEMIRHGIRVGFGQDCVLDPWYSLGTADMLDVAFMGLHVAQMTSPADMRRCYDMVTCDNAAILGLEGYGLSPGCRADIVVLEAGDPIEALRLRAQRLLVVARGKIIARRRSSAAEMSLPGRPDTVSRRFSRSG
jgi:cytosine deaminase